MNEKVPPTASNRRKRELVREGDLVTYKRKRKTIDPSTVVPPNIVDNANEGVSKALPPTESAESMNIPHGLEFETESAQVGLGAQPPLPNASPNFDVNIPIVGGYSEGEGAASNDEIGSSDKSLLKSFRFHRARSITLGQDLNGFKSLKVGGAGNSLSLKKLKEYYAYKLEKFLSYASRDDGRQFTCCTTLLESWIFAHFPKLAGIPKKMDSDAYEHCTCWKRDISVTDRYGGTALLNFREALDNYKLEDILECKNLEEKNTYLKAELRQKTGLEDYNQSLFVELNKKCKVIESLKVVNAILIEQIDMQLPQATPLVVLQSHQPVPDTTLAKKHEDLLAAHEDVKKKLIAKEDFEVWRQALKKALASEGMGDMGDPTFENIFKQNERFFTIAQQIPKGDYQEDLVSTAVTLENVVITRREKMAKKKKMQELLF
ncbi:hypothetical protein GIB67_001687 [Kingdonia uniflora]|uniref:Uncharacterized protein n=1 Tax=Kingdonia uniflora TaxID=39325 RepID=A0A7J7LMN0_9MAGN|nr:hypothetical protein GIB67_001687 [Kingdonia uniflora]